MLFSSSTAGARCTTPPSPCRILVSLIWLATEAHPQVLRCSFSPKSQEYGAHVPLSVLDADTTTLRSLVPLVKAGTGGEAAVPVAGVSSSETMVRDSPGT